MSDTNVATAAAPAAAPSEAVIDQSPVARPNPVGSQAPQKPVGDIEGSPHRTESRRDTISRAFQRANERAGMGHNNPPEPMAKERTPPPRTQRAEPKTEKTGAPAADEKFDLKKRPADQQPRDQGRFAPRERPPGERGQQQRQPSAAGQTPPAQQLPSHAPYHQPPSQRGWSQAARNDWATTPESVRADVHRMHKEFMGAQQSAQADRQEMDTLRPYQQLAKQGNTTIAKALENYLGIERMLTEDPIAGLSKIVDNLNRQTSDGRRLTLRDIAHYLATQSPEGHQLLQARNQQQVQQHQMGQLYQSVNQLARQQEQLIYGLRYNNTRGAVDRFAETHPRIDELGDDIKRELGFGFKLNEAYRRAALLRPAAQADQTRTTSAQTRSVDRSISGAPAGPTNGSGRRPKASASVREAVANAQKRVNGSI
jgi:hypothetical protein